jgi:holin-like protein
VAGEALVRLLGLPVPGAVLGMLLLLIWLGLRGGLPASLEEQAPALLDQLALLILPAGVGIITVGPLVEGLAFRLGLALVGATLATLVGTALLLRLLLGRR